MKKQILSLLLIVITVFALAACGEDTTPTDPVHTEPTLPDFREELTPLEQLTAAAEKTKNASSFAMEFGQADAVTTQLVSVDENGAYTSHLTSGEDREVWIDGHLRYERIGKEYSKETFDQPFGADVIFSEVKRLLGSDDLLEEFCSMELTATPSNDGSFRFSVTGLTADEFSALTGHTAPEDAVCSIAMVIDADGYFSRLEFNAGGTATYIDITQIGEDLALEAPDWIRNESQ